MPRIRPDVVQRLREGKGWSQEELARKAGIDVKTLSRMVKGLECNISTVAFVAGALNTEAAQIIDNGEHAPKPANESQGMPPDKVRIIFGEMIDVTMGIECMFELFKEVDALGPFLESLVKTAQLRDKIEVKEITQGSVRLTVSVSQEDYVRLMAAFEKHKLDSLDVKEIAVPEGSLRLLAGGLVTAELIMPFLGPALLLYLYSRFRKAGIQPVMQQKGIVRFVRVADVSPEPVPAEPSLPAPNHIRAITLLAAQQNALPAFPFAVTLNLAPTDESAETSTVLMKHLHGQLLSSPALNAKVQFNESDDELKVVIADAETLNDLIQIVLAKHAGQPVIITAGFEKADSTEYATFTNKSTITTRLDPMNLDGLIRDIEQRFKISE